MLRWLSTISRIRRKLCCLHSTDSAVIRLVKADLHGQILTHNLGGFTRRFLQRAAGGRGDAGGGGFDIGKGLDDLPALQQAQNRRGFHLPHRRKEYQLQTAGRTSLRAA